MARCWIVEAGFFLRCTLPLSLILHELGRRFMKTNYTTSAREMIFTLTGGEYNLRYFLRYFQIFVYYSQVTQSRQFFLQSWATEIRAFMKGPETAKNQVLLNHRQMKPSCLASRIYYGGTSFSIRQTRKKGATLVQVPFLRWRFHQFRQSPQALSRISEDRSVPKSFASSSPEYRPRPTFCWIPEKWRLENEMPESQMLRKLLGYAWDAFQVWHDLARLGRKFACISLGLWGLQLLTVSWHSWSRPESKVRQFWFLMRTDWSTSLTSSMKQWHSLVSSNMAYRF